ncbi:hypothetical protein [Fodinicola acaciae]|uniref:hypothetical protein n=1 Tax=Fodinicola acaciae TaxID=2681555 RepID=UPI0013D1604E|nr:hypothetical protein [Fodinicola acaciae]
MALEDGVDTYTHNPRDNLAEIVVVTGGTLAEIRESAPGFVSVEFRLTPPLAKHEPTSLQYISTYYPTSNPRTEVRRAARGRAENVDMRVCFEGVKPQRAWWTVWDSYLGGTPVHTEEVEITEIGELHRFVPYIEQTVVGFRWDW